MKSCCPKLLVFAGLLIICLTLTFTLQAASPQNEPVGDLRAKRGGQLILHTSEFPKSFNYFVENSVDAFQVFALVYDSLLDVHPTTAEFQPLIAKSWEISPDKKTFTFHLDPRAKWFDGKPITTEDIKFTYNTIMNPKNLTSVQRMGLNRFNPPKFINKDTVKFTAKTVHFNNFVQLALLKILPKHLFIGKDFNKAFNMSLPPGSGPYILTEVKEGRYYTLKRNKNYWADKLPSHRGTYNFDLIKFKIMDSTIAFEAFKKGDFDVFNEISSKRWVTETNSTPFQKNWIIKQKIYNHEPRSFAGLAFNMRRPLFQDVRIRKAICYLLDRKYLIEKIMYNQYQPLTSYWPSLYSSNETSNEQINYDPLKAKQLLKEAGYTRLDKDGYLINDKGARIEFTIIYVGESFEKHLTFFAETCKQCGVKVNLQLLSGATLTKKVDNYEFDTALFGWQATLWDDPEQLWHSKHRSEPGASNITGYKNDEVDKLIESLPPIFDTGKREEIIKRIDHLIYQDYPYALFWDANYSKIFYKNIFDMPKTVFTKYGTANDLSDVITYWWIDSVKLKHYQEAVKGNKTLPGEPVDVYYDKITNQK